MARGSNNQASGNPLLFGSRQANKIKTVDLGELLSVQETIGIQHPTGVVTVSRIPSFIQGDFWIRGEALVESEEDFDDHQNDIGSNLQRKPGLDFVAHYKNSKHEFHAVLGATPALALEQLSSGLNFLVKDAPLLKEEDWLVLAKTKQAARPICLPSTKRSIHLSSLDDGKDIPVWLGAHFAPKFGQDLRIYQAPWYSEDEPQENVFLVTKEFTYADDYYYNPSEEDQIQNMEVIGAFSSPEQAEQFKTYAEPLEIEANDISAEAFDNVHYVVHCVKHQK